MKHSDLNLIYALLALTFIIFSMSTVRLYREQMNIKAMVSGGLMDVKEELRIIKENQQTPISATTSPSLKKVTGAMPR